MRLPVHRPSSRLIKVEHPEVSTFESDFQTCLCLVSPKHNVKIGKENKNCTITSEYLKNQVFL